MRAPVAPMGWPSAIAPPFTLSRSGSNRSSRSQASTWAANASFTSTRSKSSRRRETPLQQPAHRGDDADAHHVRVHARRGHAQRRAPSACTPSSRARSAASTTIAAAPSVMPDELPAVTVPPSSLNTGGSLPSEAGGGVRRADARPGRPRTSPFLPAHRQRARSPPRTGPPRPRRGRPLLAAQREGVLLLARDRVALGQGLRRLAHELLGQRALEAVLVHRVHHRLVAHAVAPAGAR